MKPKRSTKKKKKITKKTRRRSNPSGFRNPKGLAKQSGGASISGGQTTAGMIAGGNIYAQLPPEPIVNAFYQLRPPPADFVGRKDELKILREYVKQGGATICAIRGLGGLGKTTLALKLANELKQDYPDAQFYLNLQGASDKPRSPSDALAQVIRAYHPTAKLPESEVELRSIYLSLLDGKRALLLMDNAKDAAQVEPLIPPSTCLLLITSRNKFVLPAIRAIDLDSLPHDDARNLLHTIAPHLTQYEIRITDDLVSLCASLPLALRLAGSALAEHIDLEPTQYLKRLQDKKNRLQLIEASLSLSYDLLTKGQQKLWRMLAVFPSSFEINGAGAVWGIIRRDVAMQRLYNADTQDKTLDKTQEALSAFARYSILDYDSITQRYRLHDLAKVFADSRLSEREKYEAVLRHATHYRDVLKLANSLYRKGGENISQGLKLYDTEVENINAGQAWAGARVNESDEIANVCRYYAGQSSVLDLRLHPRTYIGWIERALIAAQKLKNKKAEGVHLGNLGNAYAALGETRKAIEFYEQHLAIAREIGDRGGEGRAFGNLGIAYAALGETRKAIEFFEQDLAIAREIGNRGGEGTALGNLGIAYAALGETRKAIEFFEQHLAIAREIGDRRGEGIGLWNMALTFDELGERAKAIEYAEESLKIFEAIESRYAERVRKQLEEWKRGK